MIVYVDVLFIINVLMDTTMLWAAGALLKERIRLPYIVLGASAGSFTYIVSLFFPYRGIWSQIMLTVFSVALSAAISFRPKSLSRMFQITLMTVLISFAASGIIFFLMILKTYAIFTNIAHGITDAFSYKLLVVTSVIFYIGIKAGKRYIFKTVSDYREYFDIDIHIGNLNSKVRALADTGNSLRDNITGKDIIIAEYSAVKSLLPRAEITTNDSVEIFRILSETDIRNRLRLIPFKSIGNENGMMLGIKADEIIIFNDAKIKKSEKDVIICIFMGKLDSEGKFNAIINYEIIL